ncbi:Ammonium transporter [Acidisarcina polymorpha]|uniref:Ammonium transporter n=2 Tax=Acidisarcina polymorpha TaxID=2211140 RepID=A0A2Z5G082_9BACT|nr:Ammonium transporter [Acidisarcina polymorpha]
MILCLTSIFLIPLAIVGLALMNAGLGRSRNAAHLLVSTLGVLSVAVAVYFVCGYAFQGSPGLASYWFKTEGKQWDWIGGGKFFFRGVVFDGSLRSLNLLFQLFCVGLAAMIPLGSGGGRWKLSASAISSAVLAGWTYPLFAHWVWGGGWLAQLGTNFGLGQGFVDVGGSTTIHAVGGLTGLCVAWILGPRLGKYSPQGMPAAIPGHDMVMAGLGCLLAFVGWLGLNSAGAVLFANIPLSQVVLVGVNTVLSTAFAILAAAIYTRIRFGKPDTSLCMNGCVGGLVASSAGCAVLGPPTAALTGALAGILVAASVEFLELRLKVDDPGGSISMHGVSGLWGAIAVALFAPNHAGQWLAQLTGIATVLGLVLPFSYGVQWGIDRVWPMRVSPEAERLGLDLHELGAGAYPEFMIHGDEFLGS